MNRKLIALCLICSILGSSTSAFASTTSNTSLPTPIKSVVTPNLGGGPSPTAVWTYKGSTNKSFSRSQIQSLYNQAYNAHVAGETSNQAYNFALAIMGFMPYGSPALAIYLNFCTSNSYKITQTSMNTLGRALASGHATVTIEILTWERPASGDKMCAFNSLP